MTEDTTHTDGLMRAPSVELATVSSLASRGLGDAMALEVRRQLAVAGIDREELMRDLIYALDEESEVEFWFVAEALGMIGDPSAVPQLVERHSGDASSMVLGSPRTPAHERQEELMTGDSREA